jgi:hypothetical protein
MMCPLLIVGRKHVEFRHLPQARGGSEMENRLKRELAGDVLTFCLGVNQARTPNIALIAASAGFDGIYVDPEHSPTSLEGRSSLGRRREAKQSPSGMGIAWPGRARPPLRSSQ